LAGLSFYQPQRRNKLATEDTEKIKNKAK